MSITPPVIPRQKPLHPLVKIVLEMGPLILFFFTNARFGIYTATGVLMGGVVVSLIASYWLTRHLPIMPVVTAGMVVVFGSLTFVFHDESFIKIKPTIINALMGSVLLGGLVLGRPLLPVVLDSVLHLDEKGWHKLTFRWGVFFLFLAVLNEIVWRQVTTDQWVTFKTFGTMPVTLIFLVSQMPLILRHQITKNDSDQAPDHF